MGTPLALLDCRALAALAMQNTSFRWYTLAIGELENQDEHAIYSEVSPELRFFVVGAGVPMLFFDLAEARLEVARLVAAWEGLGRRVSPILVREHCFAHATPVCRFADDRWLGVV